MLYEPLLQKLTPHGVQLIRQLWSFDNAELSEQVERGYKCWHIWLFVCCSGVDLREQSSVRDAEIISQGINP